MCFVLCERLRIISSSQELFSHHVLSSPQGSYMFPDPAGLSDDSQSGASHLWPTMIPPRYSPPHNHPDEKPPPYSP